MPAAGAASAQTIKIAGIVEKTGANITSLKAGDAVYGYPTFGGGWAEYITVKEWEVAPKPKSLSFAEAAAVPMGALTAWQALVDAAKLHAGQTILIHGGSGGVGSFAIQIAKAHGARVIATASTANQDLLKQLGMTVDLVSTDWGSFMWTSDIHQWDYDARWPDADPTPFLQFSAVAFARNVTTPLLARVNFPRILL